MKRRHQRTKQSSRKKHRSARPAKNRLVSPRTVEEFFAMSERDQERWKNVSQTVTEMRAGASLRQASRKFSLDPRTVRRLASSAFRRLKNGRYAAKTIDRLLRVLVIPTRAGLREIGVRDSRQATLLADYWVAVERYLATGDASALRKIRHKTITNADGKRIRLIKNLAELERLGSAGVLSFESLYAKAA